MISSVSRPVRRMLAVAILLALVFCVWSIVVVPLNDYISGTEADVQRLQSALGHGSATDQELAALQRQVAALRQQHDKIGGLILGVNESIATAQMQTRVKEAAEAAGGELQSIGVLPLHDEGPYRRITVEGQMMTTLPVAQRVVYELEAASPYLFFDRVEIHSRLSTLDAAHAGQNPTLDVHFEVSGYMRRST